MDNSKRAPKVDKENDSVVRPLIKRKKGLGGFMKFLAAYVPALEHWIVIGGDNIFKRNLTEADANNLVQILNSEAWLATKVEADAKEIRIQNALLDFEAIYKEYPRKRGKRLGLKRLQNSVKTPEKYKLLMQAVLNYKKECEDQNKKEEYIKHFSTWVMDWNENIPVDTNVSSLPEESFEDISKNKIPS